MEFVINNLPIALCLIIGLALVIIEMFMPGFGFIGLSGFTLLVGAVVFTWINYGAMVGSLMMIAVLILVIVCVVVSLRSASKGRLSRSRIFLKQEDNTTPQAAAVKAAVNAGDEGVTETALRPAGFALIRGERVNVISEGQFIDKGVSVRVTQVEGGKIVVEQAGNA